MIEAVYSEHSSRRLINVFFAYIMTATCVAGWYVSGHVRQWTISDWLINYEGGFVRRGLPGQFAYLLGGAFQLAPSTIAAICYISLFVWFQISVFRLASASSLNIWVLAILLSPATFSMQLLNPQAGFHKEIIFLAALAAFLVWLQGSSHSPAKATVLLSVFAFLAMLSHESIIFYMPYFFAAFLLSGRTFSCGLRYLALPSTIALLTAYICSKHLGSQVVAAHICNSLGYSFPSGRQNDICDGGAILYLTRTPAFARLETLAVMRNNHYWKLRTLIIPVVLALLPIVAESVVLAKAGRVRNVIIVWSTASLSILGSIILFVYAYDWGRWLYIHFVSISLCLLYSEYGRRTAPIGFGMHRHAGASQRKIATGALLFVYATVWSLPNDVKDVALFGYAGRVYSASRHILERGSPARTASLGVRFVKESAFRSFRKAGTLGF